MAGADFGYDYPAGVSGADIDRQAGATDASVEEFHDWFNHFSRRVMGADNMEDIRGVMNQMGQELHAYLNCDSDNGQADAPEAPEADDWSAGVAPKEFAPSEYDPSNEFSMDGAEAEEPPVDHAMERIKRALPPADHFESIAGKVLDTIKLQEAAWEEKAARWAKYKADREAKAEPRPSVERNRAEHKVAQDTKVANYRKTHDDEEGHFGAGKVLNGEDDGLSEGCLALQILNHISRLDNA